MFNAQDDPLGLALAQRARAARQRFNADADTADIAGMTDGTVPIQSRINSQFERGRSDAATQGYNAPWDSFFQALQEKQDDAASNGMKFKVNTRTMGNPPMDSLNDAPMPEDHSSWTARTKARIYGPSIDSLNRGR